jgi:rhodanese-related sulfurtransferase
MPIATIAPLALADELKSSTPIDLIDVRSPAEYHAVHAERARLVPLDSLDPGKVMATRCGKPEDPLYILCHSGARARTAAEKFVAAGYENVCVVEGGTKAWQAAGLPVVTGKAGLSVDRQVRLVIGGGVLAGAALAWWVHPAWVGLSAFFGLGLFVAGLTDFCGLAVLIAAMPWNKSAAACGTCCTTTKA